MSFWRSNPIIVLLSNVQYLSFGITYFLVSHHIPQDPYHQWARNSEV